MFTSLSPSLTVSWLVRGGEVIKTQACQFQRHAHNGFPLKDAYALYPVEVLESLLDASMNHVPCYLSQYLSLTLLTAANITLAWYVTDSLPIVY